ncbi:MAG: hypothetical protein HY661_03915 [Betaproteobacteria bacterium]|nr:hypothetical protein [Betaproteobacteria bacterium]
MTTNEATELERIARDFIDENGRTLAERERHMGFYVRYGEPGHREKWEQHKTKLLAEVAALRKAISGASPTAWVATGRLMKLELPKRPQDRLL